MQGNAGNLHCKALPEAIQCMPKAWNLAGSRSLGQSPTAYSPSRLGPNGLAGLRRVVNGREYGTRQRAQEKTGKREGHSGTGAG